MVALCCWLPSPLHLLCCEPPRFKTFCLFRGSSKGLITATYTEARRNAPLDFTAPPSVLSRRIFENQPAECNGALLPGHMLMSFSGKWHTEGEPELGTSIVPSFSDESQTRTRSHSEPKMRMMPYLGQCINSAGIVFTLKVIFKEPRAALPHISVPDIRWIDWRALKESGFEGVVFDKDNTLTAPYVQTVCPSLALSIEECKTAFEGRVALLSNSAGLYQYDPDGMKAKAVEEKLGVPVIRHGSKKPAGSAEELKNYFGCDSSFLVMVGDRHFTDIVYGNKNGLLTVITKPLTLVGEPFIVRQVRLLEAFCVQRWYQKGLLPVQHKLLSQNCNFVKDPSCG